jgi:hypothetical protein
MQGKVCFVEHVKVGQARPGQVRSGQQCDVCCAVLYCYAGEAGFWLLAGRWK